MALGAEARIVQAPPLQVLLENGQVHQHIGDYMRSLRMRCDKPTLVVMARLLGCSVSFLSDLEHGHRHLTPGKAVRWAEVLGIDASVLLVMVFNEQLARGGSKARVRSLVVQP